MTAAKCLQCPNPTEGDSLCGPCSIELAHRIMNAEPDPEFLKCAVCQAEYRHTEARVLRHAKNPRAAYDGNLSYESPRLCWVCARLHHSARREATTPMLETIL